MVAEEVTLWFHQEGHKMGYPRVGVMGEEGRGSYD